MIAHVVIRRTYFSRAHWIHAYGWVCGDAAGSGLADTRAEAIRDACCDAVEAGATVLCLPSTRDFAAIRSLPEDVIPSAMIIPGHPDAAAAAVAQRAASVEIMRECIRRRGIPALTGAGMIDKLGGPETVAAVIGCDAAQVCRWARAGKLPDVRLKALRRELEAMA